jgi:hypothetical protein
MENLWERLMGRWSELVFRERAQEITPKIRALRALEEMMELAQAENISSTEVTIIRDQVYNKPPGDPIQEVCGVMVTMAGYAMTKGIVLERCFWMEFERMMDPAIIEKVRHRNLEGDKIGFNKGVNND